MGRVRPRFCMRLTHCLAPDWTQTSRTVPGRGRNVWKSCGGIWWDNGIDAMGTVGLDRGGPVLGYTP